MGSGHARIPDWILEHPELSGDAVKLWGILQRRYENRENLAWPARETIARRMNVSEPTVTRKLRELVEHGALTVVSKPNPNQKITTTVYRLEHEPRIKSDAPSECNGGSNMMHGTPDGESNGASDLMHGGGDGASDGESNGASDLIRRPFNQPRTNRETKKRAPSPAKTSGKTGDNYSDAFEQIWKRYPRRAGGNPKPKAWRAYSARLTEGKLTEQSAIEAVERYRKFCDATEVTGTKFVLQTSSFFGPEREGYADDWTPPEPTTNGRRAMANWTGFENKDYRAGLEEVQ